MGDLMVSVDMEEAQKPWLSIIMPIYNAEKFLCKCLDSILEQTFLDFEVILVDDGSADASADLCMGYASKDSRIRYFRKDNGGAFKARIYGAERARGTYISFCDADDYYVTKNAFALIHDELAKGNYCAIQFGIAKKYNHLVRKKPCVKESIDFDKQAFFSREYPLLLASSWEGSHLTPSVWNKVYHRKLLSNLPASDSAERVFWGEDQILNLHLLSKCESVRIIPDVLYCYRQLYGGSKKFSLRTMKDVDTIKKYQLLFLNNYQEDSKEKILRNMYAELAAWFFLYVQQALDHLSDTELTALINETLTLPRFVLAKEYYTSGNNENWDGVNLLRKADANEYIKKAKEYHSKRTVKDIIIKFLKHIYSSL